ncbi:hypothetical protein [Blastomonas sp.]|uniref:hypothetical protein n=1 Tax=Blastomonas sp. TaxID=1909299 RepID=UPI00262961FC|nr:hypothetical protein [Blastomonas sp.]MDM7957218.1 hypothetical protein [Blastomonas sp.]
MKPGITQRLAARSIAVITGVALSAMQHAQANPLAGVTLDGISRAGGIREWIEIAEPGNLGLLLMGVAGVVIGRWAAGKKRKDPPER